MSKKLEIFLEEFKSGVKYTFVIKHDGETFVFTRFVPYDEEED